LLSLSAFEKRTQKTPPREIEIAETRLRDWRNRGVKKRAAKVRTKR
jgi:phage-related protein